MIHHSTPTEELVSSLKTNGYVVIERAVSASTIDLILAEVKTYGSVRINPNTLGAVFHGRNQFFTNIIAYSKVVHDIITSDLVLDLCSAYLGGEFLLSNNRLQTTLAKVEMPWHTDNNILKHGKLVGRHSMPGLQFVLYLTDVSRSPFQLIRNSHTWSLQHPNHYLNNADVERLNHEVVSLIPSPGSLLILNTHVFHRAAPIADKKYMRSILLFQADKISPDYPEHGEKLIINPEFINSLNPRVSSFLGFGRKRSYQPFPETSLYTLGPNSLVSLQAHLFKAFPKAFITRFVKWLIPQNALASLKNQFIARRLNPSNHLQGGKQNPYT